VGAGPGGGGAGPGGPGGPGVSSVCISLSYPIRPLGSPAGALARIERGDAAQRASRQHAGQGD
ncbi:MAG: hypothetical protein M3433_04020, partial [Actinomycetota bacterium]|nr:hypothetical protein [Actinomycetota bacterium]